MVVNGFPEDVRDYTDLLDMLAFLGCSSDVVRHESIGRISNNTPAVRPIKVVLRSACDREFILSRTNLLRGDTYYSGTYISRWLSQNDLNKVKILRHQCRDLNKASPTDKKGRKPYVVISGQLMK